MLLLYNEYKNILVAFMFVSLYFATLFSFCYGSKTTFDILYTYKQNIDCSDK